MRKKLFTIVITIFPSLLASHSYYVGANLNVNQISGKRSDSVNDSAPFTPSTQSNLSNNKKVSGNGVYGGVLAGYLFRFKNFGVGPEFFYNYGNVINEISGRHFNDQNLIWTDFDIKYRIISELGVNARFGYFIESYFLYTLLGINFQSHKYQFKATQDNNNRVFEYRTPYKTTSGFSFGLGLQKQINENYDIGLEYKVTDFPRKNFEFKLDDDNNTKLTSDIKYKIHSIGLRFIYKF